MQQKPYSVEFAFRGEPVGFFIGEVLPCGDCEQEYEAYRGPGHYKLGQELSAGGWARCSYDNGVATVTFDVRRSDQPGTLLLSNFLIDAR